MSATAEVIPPNSGPAPWSDPVPEAVALADLPRVEAAATALALAQGQYADARIRAQAADEAVADVRTEMPALVEKAVAGEAVGLHDVVAVRNRVLVCESAPKRDPPPLEP